MQISRRRFFLTTMAIGVAPLAITSVHADALNASLLSRGPLDLLVYDDRFSEAVLLAREAARQRITVRPVRGDVTQLWYDDLYHRWQQKLDVIAGLTTIDALFCLETLGADVGLRRVMSPAPTQFINSGRVPLQGSPLVSWMLAPIPPRAFLV